MALSEKAVALLKENAEVVKEITLAYHGNVYGWKKFVEANTTSPVRFKDYHGNDVRDGEEYWFVTRNFELFYIDSCDEFSGKDNHDKYFSTESSALEYIKLNKPCELSVNEIVDFTIEFIEPIGAPIEQIKVQVKTELLQLIANKKSKV